MRSAESPGGDGGDDNGWQSTGVRDNDHRCNIEAANGFHIDTRKQPLSMKSLAGRSFKVDTKPREWDDVAFDIYLVGDDSIAQHVVTFTSRKPDGRFAIDWKGKACLSYVGATEYKHRFHTHIFATKYESIRIPDQLTHQQAKNFLIEFVSDVSDFRLVKKAKLRAFLPGAR